MYRHTLSESLASSETRVQRALSTIMRLKPELIAQVEFAEWTDNNHLRHAQFLALRDDKEAVSVKREKHE